MLGLYFFNFPEKLKNSIRPAAKSAAKAAGFKNGDINFIFVCDKEIKRLNASFRKVRRITDVISFKYDIPFSKSKASVLGDIYISRGRSKKQARRFGHSWEKELSYLAIHGVLHLAGYTDYVLHKRRRMFALQDKIFQCLYS